MAKTSRETRLKQQAAQPKPNRTVLIDYPTLSGTGRLAEENKLILHLSDLNRKNSGVLKVIFQGNSIGVKCRTSDMAQSVIKGIRRTFSNAFTKPCNLRIA